MKTIQCLRCDNKFDVEDDVIYNYCDVCVDYMAAVSESHRLQHVVDSQLKALHEWRKKADLDYVQMQRLYNALEGARIFIEVHGGDEALLAEIDEVTAGVEFMPPKVFV